MLGCDSRNSPIVGSSVKPCTPWPVVYTSIVLEPYRMYPAATCFLPAWRQSASPAGSLRFVTRRCSEKIVPIETFTSMLVEPSSGSYNTTYLPAGLPEGTGTGSSSSSEAVTHTRPLCWMLWRTVSLAKRSSFCCRSPETFTAPAVPRMSVSPARRTWREMIFAARQRSYSRFDSSPVASGWSRSCSMMKRSIVMTSDPSTVAVRGEGDGAALVGPQNRHAVPRQPRQHLRRRMAVMVAPPHADHGLSRAELRQPGVRRGGARAVVPHLQQLHRPHPAREPRLDGKPRVRLEQQPHRAVGHAQHDAVLVHVERQGEECGVRAQHLERHAVQLNPIPSPGGMIPRSRRLDLAQELEVQRTAQRFSRLEHHVRPERAHHRRQPAQVIRVAVRRHDQREPARAPPPEKRDHHPAARVALGRPRAAVPHPPAPRPRAQRRGVAPPDRQEKYGQTTTGVERCAVKRRIGDGSPADKRHDEGAPACHEPAAAGRCSQPPRGPAHPPPH